MAENNQKIKLLRIMEFLRAESSVGKPVSTSQIISYLNSIHISCERRTLYKDMDMLIESGANIVKTELGRENAYYMNEVSFSLAEVKKSEKRTRRVRILYSLKWLAKVKCPTV